MALIRFVEGGQRWSTGAASFPAEDSASSIIRRRVISMLERAVRLSAIAHASLFRVYQSKWLVPTALVLRSLQRYLYACQVFFCNTSVYCSMGEEELVVV